jgi:hypothetical protein
MLAAKFRRLQARHRINQFYVLELNRFKQPLRPCVASAAFPADGAVAQNDEAGALKPAAGGE